MLLNSSLVNKQNLILGWTPLHEAANHGHYNVAVMLVKAGANVNAQAMDDVTPLHDAAIVGQLKMVKMLVEKGADPLAKNKKGKTPQDVAHPSLHNFFRIAIGKSSIRHFIFTARTVYYSPLKFVVKLQSSKHMEFLFCVHHQRHLNTD